MLPKSEGRYVYVVASAKGTLYTGHINDLRLAVHRHRTKEMPGRFVPKKLVYYEVLPNAQAARKRLKQIKGLARIKKVALVSSRNPEWNNLLP